MAIREGELLWTPRHEFAQSLLVCGCGVLQILCHIQSVFTDKQRFEPIPHRRGQSLRNEPSAVT